MDISPDRASQLLSLFLHHSNSVAMVCVDGEGRIIHHNRYFASLMQKGDCLAGSSFTSCLLPESAEQFWTLGNRQHIQQKLNFADQNNSAVPLHCHIFGHDGQTVILGEKLMLGGGAILNTMSSLNTELALTARELQRTTRKLRYVNTTSQKSEHPIPICSYCKDVRSSEGEWKMLEEALSELMELRFTHSICQSCFEEHHSAIPTPDTEV